MCAAPTDVRVDEFLLLPVSQRPSAGAAVTAIGFGFLTSGLVNTWTQTCTEKAVHGRQFIAQNSPFRATTTA